ncbi:MAG: DUF6220 domain-containing protein [Chloroflexi bacterium]|nr:DUF6220 domain-containing protein [Chloroflexota bacterium]
MQRIIAQIHQGLAWIVLAALLIQFYLAGTAIFGAGSFEPHRSLGGVLLLPVLLLLVLALVGRLGGRVIGLSLLLVVLFIVQGILPALRDDAAWVAALHPVNALALMGISATIGRNGGPEALRVS